MKYKDYFISQYPNEGVGYMKRGKFYPLKNLSTNPEHEFEVDPSFLLKKPDVLLHSHCTKKVVTDVDPREPSYTDLLSQQQTAIEWGICVTDGEVCNDPIYWGNPTNRPPLLEREFIHGIQDCLALVQDWYFTNLKIELPTQARHPDFFKTNEVKIEDKYIEWGFVPVEFSDLQVGDVIMYKVRSEVANHLAIYVGDSMVLTHWFGRLSATESIGKWKDYITLIVRYKDKE